MLIGNNVILREIEDDDLKYIVNWRNDVDILKWLFSYLPLSLSKQRRWYERYLSDDTSQIFIIEQKQESKSIGTIGLTGIDHKNQKAEIGILIEKGAQNSGFGLESIKMLLDYAFDEMNLRKITARLFQDNIPAIKLYEKIGFVKEGILIDEIYKSGKYKNVVIMAKFK